MITEASIKAAIKRAPDSGKSQITLKDDGPRGAGRLALVVRPMAGRISAEWYAIYFRDSKRTLAKIGTYPEMTLAQSREIFRDEYAPKIVAGDAIKSRVGRVARVKDGGITVRELFTLYIEHLEAREAESAYQARCTLLDGKDNAASALGENAPANSVEAAEVSAYLATIFRRGKRAMATTARAYIRAAYAWACKAKNDYTTDAGIDLGVSINPVANVPFDIGSVKEGTRFLGVPELRDFYLWLESTAADSMASRIAMLEILTGQRCVEIRRMRSKYFDAAEAIYEWPKTKNKKPHAIPLPARAVKLLKETKPNENGLYFPNDRDPKRVMVGSAVRLRVRAFIDASGCAEFTVRDIRRTWKTLAGKAGISKEMRDRLQNHAQSDVSSKHYDRYDYMPEKLAAMKIWEAFLNDVLADKKKLAA